MIITLGGMKVIDYTDVIQVTVLIIGGFATIYMALSVVAEKFGTGSGVIDGLYHVDEEAPEHFHMIL